MLMVRVSSRQALAAWFAGGLLLWSCSESPESKPSEGRAGSTGASGASAGIGASSSHTGGLTNSQAGDAQGVAGLTGSAGNGGSGGQHESGGSAPAGMGSGAESGSAGADGGAAGSGDSSVDYEGHCGQGWAAASSARLPHLTGDVAPQVDSKGNWSFTFGRYRFVVAGSHGARVIEFSIDGNNLLEPSSGSTFWPSPQQAYPWPLPAELDTAAYVASASATSLGLTSQIATTLGLSVHKRFWVNAGSGVVSIEYQLINEAKQSASWAPWEVTRVRAGGYTFAPRGPGERTITQDEFQFPLPLSLLPPLPATDAIAWLNYPGVAPDLTKDNYINEFDGAEGWLAHANRFGTKQLPVLFVKSFVDAPDESLPTNQAEIQLWTSGTASPKLIELEQQGALELLAPGAALTWTVHWSACELASSSLLSAGNAELAALARAHAIKP